MLDSNACRNVKPQGTFNLKEQFKRVVYALDDCYQRYIYECPSPSYRKRVADEAPWPDFRKKADQFCRDGILILRSHFQGEVLEGMRSDFSRWIPRATADEFGRFRLHEGQGTFLKDSVVFSRAALDPWVLALARYYWGKPVVLSQASGDRLYPDPGGKKLGPFQWHHDAKRKQLKALIYLDDVSRDGQRMDYLPGTHRIWQQFKRGDADYEKTRIPDEEVLPRYGHQPIHCEGPAGTVLLFDTNGIHRGNQNLSAKRDAWVFQYTAGRHVGPFSGIHPEVVRQLNPEQIRTARIS